MISDKEQASAVSKIGIFFRRARNLFFVAFLLLATQFSIPGVSAQIDDGVIKVESSLVVLNATITDARGKSSFGLKQPQFQIFEDGQEQKIDFFESQMTPFAAVILLDTSGSMEQRIVMARSAAINFLDGLRADDVAAIYNFDAKVHIAQDFSSSRDIAEKIYDLKADGMTVLNDAVLKAAQELAKRAEKRKAIVIISDGADTASKISADKALKAALAANITIYSLDMSTEDTDRHERMQSQAVLKNFAEKSGGIFIPTPGGGAMREAFKNIVEELNTQYTLGYQPSNTKKDGKWRSIELRVARPNLSIRTRKGYNAPKEK